MTDSVVTVGAPEDTGPVFTVIITRHPDDNITDWTNNLGVVLVLPDKTTQSVSQTSSTVAQWKGTVTYNAWFTKNGMYETHARATFPGSQFTIPDKLKFDVG